MSNVTILIFNALIAFSILVQARLGQIPPALLPCSDEVNQWWEKVRAAGTEAAKAAGQKEEMLKKKRVPQAYVPDDEDELLSKKEREKMNAEITRTTGNYLDLLREGKEKGYRVPLLNERVTVLHREPARFTNAAREAKAQGTVVLTVEFRSDGRIKVLNIVRGLGFGLNAQAVAAVQKIIFLPEIKDGTFVNWSSNLEFSFNLY
jgi:TonB family protein